MSYGLNEKIHTIRGRHLIRTKTEYRKIRSKKEVKNSTGFELKIFGTENS